MHQGKSLLVTFLFFATIHLGITCDKSVIVSEIAKFHGPEWSSLLKTSNCNQSDIKNYLRSIISSPSEQLRDYEVGQQQFLYRNAVKSFGHFSSNNDDLSFISKIYNDKNQTVQNLFGENANLFRITVLESMANTGNVEALDFFQKILENDNNVLFLQQYAADFSLWILDGSPFHEGDSLGGSRDFAEHYFPNLKGAAEERFRDDTAKLEKLKDKKDALKLLLTDMLLHEEKYKDIYPSLKSLMHSLENRGSRKPQSLVQTSIDQKHDDGDEHSHRGLELNDQKNKNSKNDPNSPSREIATEEDNNSSLSLIVKILLFALIIALLLYYNVKSKRP